MTTTTQAAHLVLQHLTKYRLPEPASLNISTPSGQPEARVQVPGHRLPGTAGVLLRWAATVTTVQSTAWRARASSVHLKVDTILISPVGPVALTVYGGVAFDPAVFAGLDIDATRPISLGQLTAWATGAAGVPS